MAYLRVEGGMQGTEAGLKFLGKSTRPRMSKVVKKAAERGNRNAKGFASEQHTMFSDVDVDYPPTFTVERVGPLDYVYGPEDVGEGRKATGYEYGSINQAYPHLDVTRSFDIEKLEFPMDVDDEMRFLWQEAGW